MRYGKPTTTFSRRDSWSISTCRQRAAGRLRITALMLSIIVAMLRCGCATGLLQAGSSPLELSEPDGQNLLHRHSAVGELLRQNELLRIGQAGRYDHFPTRFQLVDQRRRNEIGSGRHDHLVKGGVLRPTVIAIRKLEFDIAAALLPEPLFRLLAKLFDDFNGVYLAGQLREDGGLIAKTGTDFENAVVGLDVEQIGH